MHGDLPPTHTHHLYRLPPRTEKERERVIETETKRETEAERGETETERGDRESERK